MFRSLHVALIAANGLLLAAIVAVLMPSTRASAEFHELAPIDVGWSPPSWHPNADALWVLESLDGDGVAERGPKVRARGAILADLDSGEVLWSHGADDLRPVASLTKLVSALTLASTRANLDAPLCVSPAQWPTRSGARSKFETGHCYAGWDFLGAALVKSDNRGAMGLAALAAEPYDSFVERMGEVSASLRMSAPGWADPAGLEDDNLATARDMLKALVAVSEHPVLAMVASSHEWRMDDEGGHRWLGSTNRLVSTYDTVAAKTGYTDTAGWCFAGVVRTKSGRRLAGVVLGARGKQGRFDDFRNMIVWAEAR